MRIALYALAFTSITFGSAVAQQKPFVPPDLFLIAPAGTSFESIAGAMDLMSAHCTPKSGTPSEQTASFVACMKAGLGPQNIIVLTREEYQQMTTEEEAAPVAEPNFTDKRPAKTTT